jgi:Domain of unknown function (DUF4468) with TBP-like fold
MKKVLLIAMTLFFAIPIVKAQDKSEEAKTVLVKEDNSDNYYYEGVVPVEGVTKEEMFKRAKQWVLSTLKTGDNNIQFDESTSIINSSTILVKGKKGMGYSPDALINFKINIWFKEGKYKFRLDNVLVRTTESGAPIVAYAPKLRNYTKGYNNYLVGKINSEFIGLTENLEKAIKTGNASSKDNW